MKKQLSGSKGANRVFSSDSENNEGQRDHMMNAAMETDGDNDFISASVADSCS